MLTVEDGSGIAGAESYSSVVDADTYHSNRGNAAWALLITADKEINLRRATDYMQQAYRERWAGYRVNTTQALDWPRYGAPIKDSASMGYGGRAYYSSTSVPAEVKNACITLALKASAGELAPDIEPPVLSEKVGPLEVTYSAGARKTIRYIAIDRLLAPFLQGSESFIGLVRA